MQKSKKTTRVSIKDLPKRKHTVTKEEANQVKGGYLVKLLDKMTPK